MLVIEGGLSSEYVLDKMELYEIQPLVVWLYRKNVDSWEQTRFISFMIAQVNSSKKLNPQDILSFSWDKEIDDKDTSISNEDIERLRNKAKKYLKQK